MSCELLWHIFVGAVDGLDDAVLAAHVQRDPLLSHQAERHNGRVPSPVVGIAPKVVGLSKPGVCLFFVVLVHRVLLQEAHDLLSQVGSTFPALVRERVKEAIAVAPHLLQRQGPVEVLLSRVAGVTLSGALYLYVG